ncbi:TetR/AcrR family transcriptional regulator [Sulfitobacter sp. S190]|uniref:TetR/AcrR family transcriptional regulator n=1 Tax=Sulfitobacter sp. S190 TaxID=2867022 RepID=UPI0021A43613|nr:TetR/AcrR family transcriptional regulator [Sulfitobacter sp. S190]UWR21585.1 TetR family transcriptional regulator [Sulfitobacter sp. S190]
MNKALATREKLLIEGTRLLWARGYSNVPLREIALGAGVDVALVSRYFGGKRGLFEATLDGAFETPPVAHADDLIETVVRMFVDAPRTGEMPSILQMMLMNAHDPEVGPMVRDQHARIMQAKLEQLIGDAPRAALFMAAILGMSVAEKTLHLSGIAAPTTRAYADQLRHMLRAALSYEG